MSDPQSEQEQDFPPGERIPPMPVARLIGFETRLVSKGIAAVTLNAGAQHANPMGTLHG